MSTLVEMIAGLALKPIVCRKTSVASICRRLPARSRTFRGGRRPAEGNEADPIGSLEYVLVLLEHELHPGYHIVPGDSHAMGHFIEEFALPLLPAPASSPISTSRCFLPRQIGEVLMATICHVFPLIDGISIRICLDRRLLAEEVSHIREEQNERRREIQDATDESIEEFLTCVGCSPFARYGYDATCHRHHQAIHVAPHTGCSCFSG